MAAPVLVRCAAEFRGGRDGPATRGGSWSAASKFAGRGGLDAMVGASAGLWVLAVPLMEIPDDIRWLTSGSLLTR